MSRTHWCLSSNFTFSSWKISSENANQMELQLTTTLFQASLPLNSRSSWDALRAFPAKVRSLKVSETWTGVILESNAVIQHSNMFYFLRFERFDKLCDFGFQLFLRLLINNGKGFSSLGKTTNHKYVTRLKTAHRAATCTKQYPTSGVISLGTLGCLLPLGFLLPFPLAPVSSSGSSSESSPLGAPVFEACAGWPAIVAPTILILSNMPPNAALGPSATDGIVPAEAEELGGTAASLSSWPSTSGTVPEAEMRVAAVFSLPPKSVRNQIVFLQSCSWHSRLHIFLKCQ